MPERILSDASLFGFVAVGLVATTVVILRDVRRGVRDARRGRLALLAERGEEAQDRGGEPGPERGDLAA